MLMMCLVMLISSNGNKTVYVIKEAFRNVH